MTVNAPPSCQNTSVSTGTGNAVIVALECSDATGANVTYSIVSGPSHGSLSTIRQATGEVTYTPASGYSGPDSFTYHAISANGTSATRTVSVTVNPAPVCHHVAVSTTENHAAVTVSLNCSDPKSAALTYGIDSPKPRR